MDLNKVSIIAFLILLTGISAQAQGWYPSGETLKKEVLRQDTVLEKLFQIWRVKDKENKDVNTIILTNALVDSANKYIGRSRYYLDKNLLDSCLDMIHIADKFITSSKKSLKIIPND